MSTAVVTGLRAGAGVLARIVDVTTTHVRRSLATLIAFQLLLAAYLFASVAHNGWLTYQGGDQMWLVTSGWLLAHGTLATPVVSHGWPVIVAPLTWLTGSSTTDLLPYTTILQVAILGPLGTLAAYDIGARIAGRAAGLWCAFVLVIAPYLATPLFVERYRERWTDQILVQATGFTQLADYPSTVLVLICTALVLRSLAAGATREAALAGTIAGLAIAMKPSNALFLAGPALAYALVRRWRAALWFGVAILPAIASLTLWKYRGLGTLPFIAPDSTRQAVGVLSDVPVGSYWLDAPFKLSEWNRNMSNLREFFWSARLAQWAPFAGAVAIWRLSRPAAALLLGSTLAYFLVKGSTFVAGIENGSFWRLVMPALPLYMLLVCAIPLLVPTLPTRIEPWLRPSAPSWRPSSRVVGAIVAVVGLVPLAFVLAGSPSKGVDRALVVNNILVPVDASEVKVNAIVAGDAVRLSWTDGTRNAATFYRVYRSDPPNAEVDCTTAPAERCESRLSEVAVTREHSWVDPDPRPGVVYRVGVAANWLNDTSQGDVFVISPPVAGLAP
ncbi:MAG: hypothetical protein U0R50_07355 [Gaiellales bacterium]